MQALFKHVLIILFQSDVFVQKDHFFFAIDLPFADFFPRPFCDLGLGAVGGATLEHEERVDAATDKELADVTSLFFFLALAPPDNDGGLPLFSRWTGFDTFDADSVLDEEGLDFAFDDTLADGKQLDSVFFVDLTPPDDDDGFPFFCCDLEFETIAADVLVDKERVDSAAAGNAIADTELRKQSFSHDC